MTARHPLPVPTSTIGTERSRARFLDRFLDDDLGLGPRHEHRRGHLEFAPPELSMPDDVGDRLARTAAVEEPFELRIESGGDRFAQARDDLTAVPCEDVTGEHFGINRGFVRIDTGGRERPPGFREALVEEEHQAAVSSASVASFSFSAVKCPTAASMSSPISPSSASVSWCIVNPMR